MAQKKSARRASQLRIAVLPELLAGKLEEPASALDLLVTSLAKGEQHPELWAQLHEAVVREELTAEMACAYENICKEKRIKLLAPADRALLFLHAAKFFGDIFGDADGAASFARHVLESVPGHPEGFATLERLLSAQGDKVGLAKLYVDAATAESERERQLQLLRKAGEHVEGVAGADSVAIDVHQRILRIDSADTQALSSLVSRFAEAGRHREAAKVLEDAVKRAEQPEGPETAALRSRLLDLYTEELGELQRAVPHVEALLALQPDHERALAVAEALLEHKAVAARAAGALSDAYEKLGRLNNAADMLTLELKVVRGPRRVEVQRRLAILRQDVLNDPAGALELLGPAVAGDPGNDDLRRRFVELSVTLDQPLEAARLLERALRSARDGSIRARVGVEVGGLYRELGDVRRAEQALQKVISTEEGEGAVLGAARHLAELYSEAGDLKQLAGALVFVVRHEPEAEPRHAAARRLTRLCEDGVADSAQSIPAWEALIDSPWADEALRRLEPLYEKASNHAALADVLERRAARAKDADEARELAFRSAELRSTRIRDRAAALGAWRALVAKYGPSREAHARLLPLLEQEKQWEDAAAVLISEIEMAPAEERPKLQARLAQLRLSRLDDTAGALASFREALKADPQEHTSRLAVEKLLSAGDSRLEAADILEPLYRQEEAATGLIRVLETRGELAPEVGQRLTALADAVEIAESQAEDADQAVKLAGRALGEAVRHQRNLVAAWLERVQALAAAGGNPATRAEVLSEALGEHEVDSEDLLTLARVAAEALVLAGNLDGAIEAYRRALAYAPSSAELMGRIDELLVQQGSPQERLALYQSALEQPCDAARRRELLHAMAGLQRRELGDLDGAIATWKQALADDPKDQTAHQALVDVHAEQENWEALYDELQRMLEHQTGERRHVTLRRMAEAKQEQGDLDQALQHYRELISAARQPDEVLVAIEALARERNDAETTRDALEQRISNTTEPDDQAELLERLGRVQALELGDAEAAARSWRDGARLSEGAAANDERALRLYERVLHVSPNDLEAAERLIELYARGEAWSKIPDAFDVVLSAATDDAEPVGQLLSLEAHAVQAGAIDVFVRLADAALSRETLAPDRGRQVKLAKARTLSADEPRHDAAAEIYRELLGADTGGNEAVADAFEGFLEQTELTPQRLSDRRWLLGWRAEHAADPTGVLMRWAAAEEEAFSNATGALELYERVLGLDAERTDALGEVARLKAQLGDPQGALGALRSLREHAEGEERTAIDLKVAALLLDQLDEPGEALGVAESLLEANPTDPEALRILNRTLAHPDTKARAAELLERASEAAEDPQHRAQVLETLLAISTDTPELGDARRRWFERLLDASSEDPEAALAIALRGAHEYFDSEELWDAAERFARRLDQPGPVTEAYAEALERDLSPEQAEALGRRMVEFHEEWFDEPDRVIGLLQRVIALCPSGGWALDRLKLAFNSAGRWTELFDLYDQILARADDDQERTELLREAAMAAKDFAADPDRAISYLERYNELSPGDSRIESSLERLYEREGRVGPLISLLSGQLGKSKGATRQALRARVASLWLDIDEPVPALGLIEAALKDKRKAPHAVDLLERIVALPAAREAAAKEGTEEPGLSARECAADHLRRHYEADESMADVARMMEVRLENVAKVGERVKRLQEIVQLRLRALDDAAGAFENVSALVHLEPAEARHRELLGELAAQIDRQLSRAELLVEVAEEAAEPTLQAGLLREAAGIYQRRLDDARSAINHYLRVLQLAAEDQTLALDAARELDGLLEAAGRDAERCTVLEQRAALETDAEARSVALGNAARVAAESLGDLDRAIRAWRLRLDDDSQDLEALDGLCLNLEQAERYTELIVALQARASLLDSPDDTRRDLVHIARIHSDKLGDRPAGIDAWHVVRERSGRDLESFRALVELLGQEERWAELGALLLEEAGTEEDVDRKTSLFRALGDLHRTRTNQPEQALRAYVSAGDWDRATEVAGADATPADVALGVRRNLLDLAVAAWEEGRDEGRAARAADWAVEALADKLREVGSHEEVVTLLMRAAKLPFSIERQRDLRRGAACICSDQLKDAERAIEVFQELFAEDPSDSVAAGSVTRFAVLLEDGERYAELVALWEQQARSRAKVGEPSAAAALWSRAAELCEEKLEDAERAIADYREGAGLGGESALEALARLYEELKDNTHLAEALEWLCAQSSREALGPRTLRLAEAYVAIGQSVYARARLEQAATTALDAGPVRRRLAELYREARHWDKLAELLATEATRAPDAKARLGLLREAAGLHRRERNDPNAAVPLLQQAAELDPDDPALRLELSDALKAAERFEEAAAILRTQIERYGFRRPKDRALVHFQLAKVSLAAGQRVEALAELNAANKIDPAHPGILQTLAKLAFEEGQLERAERMFRALLLVVKPSDEEEAASRAEALLDLSEIAVVQEDPVRATEFVESAFEAALESDYEARALERALRARGRTELLARAVEARLEQAVEAPEAARALADLVMLHAAHLAEGEGASEQYRQRADAIQEELCDESSPDDQAWAALGKVYDCLGDAGAEASVLERRVASWVQRDEVPPNADPFYRLAEMRLADEATREEGLALLERALSIQPDQDRAEAMLRATLEADTTNRQVLGMLEQIARAPGRERTLAEALGHIIRLPDARPETIREGVALAKQLDDAQLLEQMLESALESDLSNEDALSMRCELADVRAASGELAQALQLREQAASFAPPEQARTLKLGVASAAAEQLEDFALAARLYEELLQAERADQQIWEPLLDVYRKLEAKDKLVSLIDQTVTLVDSVAARARLRLEQAHILLEQADQVDQAAQILREVLEEDPTQANAAILLSGILEKAGRNEELIDLLTSQLDGAKDRQDMEAIVLISDRLATLLEAQDRIDDALDVSHTALDWNGSSQQILHTILRLAERKGDSFVIGDALEGALRVTTGEEAAELATRLIALRKQLEDGEGIERALELGFKACPDHAGLRDGIVSLHAKRGDWAGVARVLTQALEANPNEEGLVQQLIDAYRSAGDPERALGVLQSVLEQDPENHSLYKERAALLVDLGREDEALADLERAHAQSGEYAAEISAALERAIARAEPQEERVLTMRLIEVLEDAGDASAVRARLQYLVESDPNDREALRLLAELEGRSENWEAASIAFVQLIPLEEGEGLVGIALQLADASARAQRPEDARAGLERALQVAPEHAELRDRLRALYAATGESRELARMLQQDAAAESDMARCLEHLLKAGELLLAPDGDVGEAVRVLEEARSLGPDNLEGVVLLARAYAAQGRREDAMGLLQATAAEYQGRRVKQLSGVYQEMSRMQLEDGFLTDAMESLTKAFEMDLRNGKLGMQLGELALDIEEYEGASRAFRTVSMMKPYSEKKGEGATTEQKADANYYLAWLARQAGDNRKAKILVKKALTANSDHEQAKLLLDELEGK